MPPSGGIFYVNTSTTTRYPVTGMDETGPENPVRKDAEYIRLSAIPAVHISQKRPPSMAAYKDAESAL